MRIALFWLLTAAVLVVQQYSSECTGGIIRDDQPAEKYRELGETSALQCAGKLFVKQDAGAKWRPCASAVLIAPTWALTAGHIGATTPTEKIRLTFGKEEVGAKRCVLHAQFVLKSADEAGRQIATADGTDIALIELDRAVQNVKPANRYRGSNEIGKTMTKVGYGCIGDGLAGMSVPPTQERRGGNNVIDAAGGKFKDWTVSENVLVCDFDDPHDTKLNQLGDTKPVDLEIGLSVGDSGCGWFINDDGSWKLVAIASGFLPNEGEPRDRNNPKYGAVFAGMRVSAANKWIDEVLKESESGVPLGKTK